MIGIEVKLDDPDSFLKVKETLTRIGIASKKNKTLYQTAHILHKRGQYYICHFKELFSLDGKPSTISDEDIKRRNLIVGLLVDWELVEPVQEVGEKAPLNTIKILSYKEKDQWKLESKYSIGTKK